MEQDSKKNSRSNLIGGIILIGVGFLFLLSNLGIVPQVGTMWPMFLIIVGIAIIVGGSRRRKKDSGTG
ncbi:MAG TPA: DUF5668 domain-containing protein [candidate division Zixibacteria bacterium]|nr:DUF5668 domain-containing protein [candidate division Zixibacteria bacterium]